VVERVVEVYTEPEDNAYHSFVTRAPGDEFALVSSPDIRIAVRDVLGG
jgi:hypothetical protein